MPGVKLAPGLISVSSEMMPQPICSPASIDPPVSLVLPPPVILPVKVPATRYSRDEIAVVSGATGSWVSLLADDLEVPAVRGVEDSGGRRRNGTLRRERIGRVHRRPRDPGAEAGRPARGARPRPGSRRRRLPAWQSGSTWLYSAPLVVGIQRICNGSVAREHLMAGLPNGERTRKTVRAPFPSNGRLAACALSGPQKSAIVLTGLRKPMDRN